MLTPSKSVSINTVNSEDTNTVVGSTHYMCNYWIHTFKVRNNLQQYIITGMYSGHHQDHPQRGIPYTYIPYSGKLSREKTFANFVVLWLFLKIFSEIWERSILWHSKSEQSAKVFSLKSFPLYGTLQTIVE